MPVTVEKETTTTSANPTTHETSQTTQSSSLPTRGENRDAKADRGNAWIWYVVGIIDLILALRLVFKLFGARSVGFADLLYQVSDIFVAPFRGIFPTPTSEGSVFDTAALVAIVVYMLLGWIVSRLIDLATRPNNSNKV